MSFGSSYPIKPVGQFAEVKGGKRLPAGHSFSSEKTAFPYIRAQDVGGGRIAPPTMHIENSTFELLQRYTVETGDVCLTIAGNIGDIGYVDEELNGVNLTENAVKLTKLQGVDARFLTYALQITEVQAEMKGAAAGAAQPKLGIYKVKGVMIPVPTDISVQHSISTILFHYDALIETNRSRIALLEESARLLYREWFVKLHFFGHELVKVVNGVPEGWSRVPLSEIAIVNGSSISNKETPETIRYIDIASVETSSIRPLYEIAFAEAPGRARRRVRHGDVIWSCVRPNRKSYALIWEPSANIIASTGFAVITSSAVPFSYLYLATTTDDFVAYLTNRATGATYPAVTARDFEVAVLLKPSTDVLNNFHASVEPIFALQECLKMQNNQLAEARDALLPKLMSGQLAA